MDYIHRQRLAYTAAVGLPLLFAVMLALIADVVRRPLTFVEAQLWPLEAKQQDVDLITASTLAAHFEAHDYFWMPAPGATVPPLAIVRLPRDLHKMKNVERKKSLFFRAMLPLILAENHNIRYQREHARQLLDKGMENLDVSERIWLDQLMRWYRVAGDLGDPKLAALLMRRVDEVPAAMVLAQAANESAWGTSRFAQEANNLFGQWTFDDNKGLVPAERGADQTHSVQIFENVRDSVRAYMRNINTHRAYRKLRRTREQMRRERLPFDVYVLAEGLQSYSQRGTAYVREIQAMIRSNGLEVLIAVDLAIGGGEMPLVAVKAVPTSG